MAKKKMDHNVNHKYSHMRILLQQVAMRCPQVGFWYLDEFKHAGSSTLSPKALMILDAKACTSTTEAMKSTGHKFAMLSSSCASFFVRFSWCWLMLIVYPDPYSPKPCLTPQDVNKVTYNNRFPLDPPHEGAAGRGLESVKCKFRYPDENLTFSIPRQGCVSIEIDWVNFTGGEGVGKCKIIVWEPKWQFYIIHPPFHLHK